MRRLWTALLLLVTVAHSGQAAATLLTFDDVPVQHAAPVPPGYGGLDWWNMAILNTASGVSTDSGYAHGLVSGTNVAYNGSGAMAAASGGRFDFDGAFLTAAYNDGLAIHAVGWLGPTALWDRTVTVDTVAAAWVDFGYKGIDRLTFESSGGVPSAPGAAGGTHFVLDDFTFHRAAAVPEPSTRVLLGAGLVGLTLLRRARRT